TPNTPMQTQIDPPEGDSRKHAGRGAGQGTGQDSGQDSEREGGLSALVQRILPPALIGQSGTLYFALFIMVAAVVIAALAPTTAGLPGVIFLGGIAVLAVMALFSVAISGQSDRARWSTRLLTDDAARRRHLSSLALDQSSVACLITGAKGEPLFANGAYERLFRQPSGAAAPLDRLFPEEEAFASAHYRLARQVPEFGRLAEDIPLTKDLRRRLALRDVDAIRLRLEARRLPFRNDLLLWEVHEVGSGDGAAIAPATVNPKLAGGTSVLEALPGAALVFNDAGTVSFLNDRMHAWLGLDGDIVDQDGPDQARADQHRASERASQDGPDKDGTEGASTLTDAAHASFILADDTLPYGALSDLATNQGASFRATLRLADGSERETDWFVRPLPAASPLAPANPAPGERPQRFYLAFVSELGSLRALGPHADDKATMTGGGLDGIWQAGVFDAAPLGIAILGGDGLVKRANAAFRQSANGLAKGKGGVALGDLVHADDRALIAKALQQLGEAGDTPLKAPLEARMASAEDRSAQIYLRSLEAQGLAGHVLVYLAETTEQKQLEMQFSQAQKMQAVGQLAGGIAHDFNNLLTAIIGYCDLLLVNHKVGDPSFADINQIRQNANRAANLVRQLLAFSRRQTLMPTVLSLVDALAETKFLLKRLLGEKIDFKLSHDRDLGLVKVDQGQLEQVIVNLAVNARDAMADGGTLTITTKNISKNKLPKLSHAPFAVQDYVLIEVRDTGCGIPKEILGKVFEPFFTTKGVGEGTGLGLSTVYGIVKQTGGYILIDSEVGAGTCFKIYLPRYYPTADEVREKAGQEAAKSADLSGAGTVLLVEDEDAVRAFAVRALETRGYTVFEADNGESALEILKERKDEIHLLISDVVMPVMDGPALVAEARRVVPDLKVIFISGYAQDAFDDSVERPEDFTFLAKPFSLKQLAQTVKDRLKG
ncbi:MAG: ATP-binding protein, partial [Pseudomonadota bacterium]